MSTGLLTWDSPEVLLRRTHPPTVLPTGGEIHMISERMGFQFPQSYVAFCLRYGPGTLDSWFDMATPEHTLAHLTLNLTMPSLFRRVTSTTST